MTEGERAAGLRELICEIRCQLAAALECSSYEGTPSWRFSKLLELIDARLAGLDGGAETGRGGGDD
jgi:hypothetical protein